MGDLLRSLEAGPELTSAANLSLSREGLVVASYPSHHVAVFTINGKKLRSELHSDNVQVRAVIVTSTATNGLSKKASMNEWGLRHR